MFKQPTLIYSEIRNVIQLAKALAAGEQKSLNRQHLERVIALCIQFDKEMKEDVEQQQTKQYSQLKRSIELKKSIGIEL